MLRTSHSLHQKGKTNTNNNAVGLNFSIKKKKDYDTPKHQPLKVL
jgi:hypothetical protein